MLAARREFAIAALDRDSRLLREVKAAMARIEDGSYGVCENCEDAIAARRLSAIPWARYCVGCQDGIDNGVRAAIDPVGRMRIAA